MNGQRFSTHHFYQQVASMERSGIEEIGVL